MIRVIVLSIISLISFYSIEGKLSIQRSYNEVNHAYYDSFQELADVYFTMGPYDKSKKEYGKTRSNVIVGVYTTCKDKLETAAFIGAQRHAGGNVLTVATIPQSDFPLKITSCAEVFFYPFNSSVIEPQGRTANLDHVALTSFLQDSTQASVIFKNGFDFPIKIAWHEESNQPKYLKGHFKPNESQAMDSFLGHVFAAYNMSGKDLNQEKDVGPLVDFMVVTGDDYIWSPKNRLETCEIVPGSKKFVEGDLSCDDMDLRLVEFGHSVWYHKRLGLNYVQPQMVRPVTEEGFLNRKLPTETYKWLKDWYDTQKKKYEETEGPVGPCMNQHVAPSTMVHMSDKAKDRLSKELQDILEDWYGDGELELTSIYGVRKYTNGSVLRMHVDTVQTHVVSAIINVDQEVDKDWPLIILDHDENERTVIMEPGDMLLYESAKLLHGRPEPFLGKRYENIFIHYKPRTGWDYGWV